MNKHDNTLRLAHGRDFTFVNLTDPQENAAGIAKKVRTQATTFSHQDPNRKQKGRHKNKKVRPLRNVFTSAREGQRSTTKEGSLATFLFENVDRARLLLAAADETERIHQNLFTDGGRGDPFSSYPVATLPWFDWVLDYYRNVHLPPGIRVVSRSEQEGAAYIAWHLREAMSEPCFFYMQLLNACTPLAAEGRMTQDIVLWLRGKVVATLNQAIQDPEHMLSTPVLFTVASIALHERLFGNVDAALHYHGKAFSRMISLLGGISRLKTPRIGFALLAFTDDVLSQANAEKATGELLTHWAPDRLREKYDELSPDSNPE